MLGINKCFTRCITQSHGSFGCSNVGHNGLCGIISHINQLTCGLIIRVFQLNGCLEAIFRFAFILQSHIAYIHHLVDGGCLERSENVVLVGFQELIRRGYHIVHECTCNRMFRELTGQILFLTERIFNFGHTFGAMILETIGVIALEEQVRIQICSCLGTCSQTHTINIIARYHGIYRANIHFARMVFRSCFHKVLDKCFHYEDYILESRHLLQAFHQQVHRAFCF